jgi:ATP-dependent exoDNAse (exonuclease V) beta subunit
LTLIRGSFSPLNGEAPSNYDGVVLGTVHKAKGLEFDRVLIADDFKFDVISQQAATSSSRCKDEANILYVAITRTRQHLFLSNMARAFLNDLEQKFGGTKLQILPCISMEEKRAIWEEQWRVFSSTHPIIRGISDIPWPNTTIDDTTDNPFALDSKMSEKEQRSYLRKVMLRYHPDKFLPSHSEQFTNAETQSSIHEKLNEVTQIVHKALQDLQYDCDT